MILVCSGGISMKSRTWFLVSLLLFSTCVGVNLNVDAQDNDFRGPILLGESVGGGKFTFQDIGSARVWEVGMPDSSYRAYLWSLDGCHILVRSSSQWHVFSLKNSSLRKIPESSPVGELSSSIGETWTLDGQHITFAIYINENDIRIYSIDIDTLSTELDVSLTERPWSIEWLSTHELLYQTRDSLMVWDTQTKKKRLHQRLPLLPRDLDSPVYGTLESPNRMMMAGYYNVSAYRYYTDPSNNIEGLSEEEKAAIKETPRTPGFDIYFDRKTKRHIDTNGQFVDTLSWAPSSQQIAITTDPLSSSKEANGIYVYNLKLNELRRLDRYPAMRNGEYGSYLPTWSSDETLLAFNTPNGYIVYRMADGTETKLDRRFTGYYIGLGWSPTMKYTQGSCPK